MSDTAPFRRPLREIEYGTLSSDADFLQAMSPIHVAHLIAAPLLIIHGKNDIRVPFSQAEELTAIMKQHRHSPELLALGEEGHRPGNAQTADDVRRAIVAFATRHMRRA
jgi:dipeptidyl aminopeptidase/acylaminoacyl peptidase